YLGRSVLQLPSHRLAQRLVSTDHLSVADLVANARRIDDEVLCGLRAGGSIAGEYDFAVPGCGLGDETRPFELGLRLGLRDVIDAARSPWVRSAEGYSGGGVVDEGTGATPWRGAGVELEALRVLLHGAEELPEAVLAIARAVDHGQAQH